MSVKKKPTSHIPGDLLAEERYRSLFESMTQGVVYQDADGKVISANHAAEVMLGVSLEQMQGRTSGDPRWRTIREDGTEFPGETHPAMVALRTGVPVENVVLGVFNPTLNEYRWLRVDAVPQFRPREKKPYQVYALFDDITVRKRAEDELKRSEEKYSALYSSMTEGVALHDVVYDSAGSPVDYIIADVNPAYEQITGLPRESVAGKKASDVYGTGAPPYLDIYARVAFSGKPESFETYFPPMKRHFGISVFCPSKGRFATVFRDITDRKLGEEQLREARDYLENLFNYANAPIIVWDPDLRITRFNHAFERLTGLKAEEVLGKKLGILFPESAREQSLTQIRRAVAGERLETVEIPIQSVDGGVHTVLWNSATLFAADGRTPVAAIAQGQDITRRKAAEEERQDLLVREQEARREAEAANRAKDEFLAVLSHELRTPLTAILGWVKMLESGRLGAVHARRGLEVIERNVRTQTRLIEDLLDVSRIIAGKLKLEKTIVDLAAIVQTTVESLRPAALERGLNLNFSRGVPSVPFEGDAARLQQVVWNLVSNAIKFTPEGGRVDVDLSISDGKAVIAVADTGIGIKPEFLPRLFDRFTQEDSSTTRQYTGLGLGLAIVRHIVDLHGGIVEARSEGEGKGATFTVALPLSASLDLPQRPQRAGEPIELTRPLQGLRVLFVEDDDDFRELAVEILQTAGASVESASSAAEAFSAFQRSRPDVLVSDIGLPVEDGYSLMRKIRAFEREQGAEPVPAIAVTGYAQVDDHARVHEAGYQQHLAKPVEPGVLIGIIASISREPDEGRSST